jgi:hypothetical protein
MRGAIRLAHPLGARGADEWHLGTVDQGLGVGGACGHEDVEVFRRANRVGGAVEQCRARRGGQGGQLSGLPHHRVTADDRDGGVPRPHCGREVERRHHTDDTDRMPGLHEPMPRTLRWHCAAFQLARQAHREVADIDHLLDLTEGLRGDLADLNTDEVGDVGLVLGQQLAEALDELPANRRGHGAPL